MKFCHKCQQTWEGISQPGRRDTCSQCGEDLHVCLNCRFYDEHKRDQCQLEHVDPVRDKEQANFCDEFQFADKVLPEKKADKTQDAKAQWANLFKK